VIGNAENRVPDTVLGLWKMSARRHFDQKANKNDSSNTLSVVSRFGICGMVAKRVARSDVPRIAGKLVATIPPLRGRRANSGAKEKAGHSGRDDSVVTYVIARDRLESLPPTVEAALERKRNPGP
jgi:hypothetical protein